MNARYKGYPVTLLLEAFIADAESSHRIEVDSDGSDLYIAQLEWF
jgi:hypothetical protein